MSQLKLEFQSNMPSVPEQPKQRELNFVKVANHPVGGFTLAVPINQERGSGRIYHQWFRTKADAEPLANQHNMDLCKRYKNNPEFKDCIERYLAERKRLHGH